jgi:protein-disulfide isomerase
MWITVIAGVVAVILIGALVLIQGGAPAKTGAGGLVAPASPTPLALADGRSLGKADAPVTLDVWSDFQCPACDQFAETVEPALVRDYVTPGTLRIVDHDAAFQGARAGGSYDESVEAGAGARCAADQGRYWPFHDWVFANQSGENQGAFADARLRTIAAAAGLDTTAWDLCRVTGKEQAAVRAETAQGVSKGLNATPTMYINGQVIVGLHSAADLGQLIKAAAAAAAK